MVYYILKVVWHTAICSLLRLGLRDTLGVTKKSGKRTFDIGFVDLFYDFWIQKLHHDYDFWIQKFFCPFFEFLDPETALFLRLLDPEFFLSFSTISGSRNCGIFVVSGSRNCTNFTISGGPMDHGKMSV